MDDFAPPHVTPGCRKRIGPVFSVRMAQRQINSVEDAQDVVQAIKTTRPKTIELSGNSFGIKACKEIADAMGEVGDIHVLLFDDMFTGKPKPEIHPTLTYFSNAICRASLDRLQILDLSDNAVNPTGAENLAPLLSTCLTLKELYLNNTGVGPSGGKTIGEALLAASVLAKKRGATYSLERFVLGRSRMEQEGALAMADAFRSIGTLIEVRMFQNGIFPPATQALAESLACNKDLEILDVSDNKLKLQGACGIVTALRSCKKLKELNVSDTLLREDGGLKLANALKGDFPLLQILDISGNELPKQAAEVLFPALINKHHLRVLKLQDNGFGEEYQTKFEETFDRDDLEVDFEGNDEEEEFDEIDPDDAEFKASKEYKAIKAADDAPEATSNTGPAFNLENLNICSPFAPKGGQGTVFGSSLGSPMASGGLAFTKATFPPVPSGPPPSVSVAPSTSVSFPPVPSGPPPNFSFASTSNSVVTFPPAPSVVFPSTSSVTFPPAPSATSPFVEKCTNSNAFGLQQPPPSPPQQQHQQQQQQQQQQPPPVIKSPAFGASAISNTTTKAPVSIFANINLTTSPPKSDMTPPTTTTTTAFSVNPGGVMAQGAPRFHEQQTRAPLPPPTSPPPTELFTRHGHPTASTPQTPFSLAAATNNNTNANTYVNPNNNSNYNNHNNNYTSNGGDYNNSSNYNSNYNNNVNVNVRPTITITEQFLDDADMPKTFTAIVQLADEFEYQNCSTKDYTVLRTALSRGFSQGVQQDVLLTTFMAALRLIKTDVPVPSLCVDDLVRVWELLLWVIAEDFFGRHRRKCVGVLASEESLRQRRLYDYGPYENNPTLNSLRVRAVNKGMAEL